MELIQKNGHEIIKNIYKVKEIKYTANAFTKCPIGKEWGRMFIEIHAQLGDEIPNYCEIDKFIQEEIDNHAFIIEEIGYKIYEFIKELCNPLHLSVILHDESNAFNTTYVTIEE